MKPPQFYGYSKSQRKGIIALFVAIAAIQAGYYLFKSRVANVPSSKEEKEWLAHQTEIDALKARIKGRKDTIYPFNPNYITDYKGYVLGMTDAQTDRLLAYRKSGKWMNSVADFKRVTGVSDTLLSRIAPYFKFPYGAAANSRGIAEAYGVHNSKSTKEIYPFNPNFISDGKGIELGLTKIQIARLKTYRESGKWINTVADFKNVTGVSDALLNKISPYFKFPDWVVKKYQQGSGANSAVKKKHEPGGPARDINDALEEDLTEIYGIGPNSAKKILRRRAALGAFVDMAQMTDFKGLSSKAIAGLQKAFTVGPNPDVTKVNVNTATLEQLARFPYFNEAIANAIIAERHRKGRIVNFDDLLKLNEFFTLKSKIISLYLEY